MSNDPNQPGGWPPAGQQPTSYDPQTGQPIYGDPGYAQQPPQYQQPPQQNYQQPPHYQQPPQQNYPQQQQQNYPQPQQAYGQPPQPQYPQQYPQQPQQYPQQPQAQQAYAQAPQMAYAQAPQMAYAQAPQMAYPGQAAPAPEGGLRASANATVGVSDRVRFIRLTYLHLFVAMAVFAGLLAMMFKVPFLYLRVSQPLTTFALGGRWNWGIVLAAFMVVSWVADYWATHTTSRAMQYAGLAIYVVAEALIFVPLLMIVEWVTRDTIAHGGGNPNILRDSAITTLALFGAITASVILSKKDFSWMRSGLAMCSAAAMTLVVLSILFGFNLGIVFSIAMVMLAGGYILYQTSQILAHYDTQQYVAASLALFSSVALMFWYVIRIFLRMRSN